MIMATEETKLGIPCPRCESTKLEVIRTVRDRNGVIRRTRRCRRCMKQFDTTEVPKPPKPLYVANPVENQPRKGKKY